MNHKLANGMKMWKGNGDTTTLLFSLKGLEILHKERRGQVKTMVMQHFNGILFHKSRPANKQHINQSINSIWGKGNNLLSSLWFRCATYLKFYRIIIDTAKILIPIFVFICYIELFLKSQAYLDMLGKIEYRAMIRFLHLQWKSSEKVYEGMSVMYDEESLSCDERENSDMVYRMVQESLFINSYRISCGGKNWEVSVGKIWVTI